MDRVDDHRKAASRILLVDDDHNLREAYRQLFSAHGIDIHPVASPSEAEAIDSARLPALALVDLLFDGRASGFDLCVKLTSKGIPVFAMTAALTESDDLVRAFESGAMHFWEKHPTVKPIIEDIKWFMRDFKPVRMLRKPAADDAHRVLVIDDEEESGRAACAQLEARGFIPYFESLGRRSVLAALRCRASAVLLDYNLPDADGRQVLKLLRAHPQTRNIPVVIWTGSHDAGLEAVCLEDGADGYLIKGVNDIAAIPHRIERFINLRAQPAPTVAGGSWRLDKESNTVSIQGKPVAILRPREMALLAYLIERPGRLATWQDLQRDLWQVPETEISPKETPEIAVHLGRLIKKLGDLAGACLIVQRGRGVLFEPGRWSQR